MSSTAKSNERLMAFFSNLAATLEREGGIFQDDNLTPVEVKSAVGFFRARAREHEQRMLEAEARDRVNQQNNEN
jgi:hypothetical protein